MTRPPTSWAKATRLLAPLLLLGIWQALCASGLYPASILVPPRQVAATIADLAADGTLWSDLRASVARLAQGFLLGTVSGLLVGLSLALVRPAARYGALLFHVLRQIPTIAWVPLLILTIGIEERFKIVMVALAVLFPVALNTWDGVRSVPPALADVAAVLRFGRMSLLRRLIMPAILPHLATGLRLALSRAWILLVAAELLAANSGIGHLLEWGREMFQIDVVMAGVVVAGAIGFALDAGMRALEARATPWRRA